MDQNRHMEHNFWLEEARVRLVIEVTDGCRGEFGRIDVLPLSNMMTQPDDQMNQGATNSFFQTTVQRSQLRLVLRSRRLVHAPRLTAVHQQRRLEFSYRYHNWASNERRQYDVSAKSFNRFIAWRVVGMLEGGQTQAEVAQAIGVSQSVISRIWNRFLETGSAGRRQGQDCRRATMPN
ncbi:hypothetical protein TNCV_3373691 [Trichonephila clavipes]|nr:hypothetical protein TNCV_3373691 [Trichonephila clavipes]